MSRVAGEETTASPFFSRAYGGYTRGQIHFAEEVLGDVSGATVFDPMGGQAYALGQWALDGAGVTVSDINPGPLALAGLRDPLVMSLARPLTRRLFSLLRARPALNRRSSPDYTEDWLGESVRQSLVKWGECLEVSSPFSLKHALEDPDPFRRFAIGATALAARRLASFRRTDNLTWLKPGGLTRQLSLRQAIETEIRFWLEWVDRSPRRGHGYLHLNLSILGDDRPRPRHRFVVTSPPYANRLDYTRLWAPELAVTGAMGHLDISTVKHHQIGTNLVRGSAVGGPLPHPVAAALSSIKKDPTPFSATYYHSFFLKYAHELVAKCATIAASLQPGGIAVVFVRDTVRKDTLFPTSSLVNWALTKKSPMRKINTTSIVVRSHIGYRRKSHVRGLYGLAQEEHWLAFQKVGR